MIRGLSGRGLLAVLVLLVACGQNPLAPDGAKRFHPPVSYLDAWASAETCTGVTAPFARIRWFVVEPDDAGYFETLEHESILGLWAYPHEIYLSKDVIEHTGLIRHEMMHDLLQDGEHVHEAFLSCTYSLASETK